MERYALTDPNDLAPTQRIFVPGSSTVELTQRQEEVGELLSMGLSHKRIARHLGITVRGVHKHVYDMAQRIPGCGAPTVKVTVWWLMTHSEDPAVPSTSSVG